MKITAQTGKTFCRIHDGFIMGNEIYLGVDYSTGTPREDKPEYYEEIDEPIIQENVEENLVEDMVNNIVDTSYEEVE